MQFKHFVNHPSATLSFNEQEIQLFVVCSHQHYDNACQAAGKEGGVIFTLAKELTWESNHKVDPQVEKRLTFREVDLLCKVVEPISALEQLSPKVALHHQLLLVLQMLNSEFTRINQPRIHPSVQVEFNG